MSFCFGWRLKLALLVCQVWVPCLSVLAAIIHCHTMATGLPDMRMAGSPVQSLPLRAGQPMAGWFFTVIVLWWREPGEGGVVMVGALEGRNWLGLGRESFFDIKEMELSLAPLGTHGTVPALGLGWEQGNLSRRCECSRM